MKWKIQIFLITLLLLTSITYLTSFVLADIYYYTWQPDVFPLPAYNTYVKFSSNQIFTQAYRENEYWYFTKATISLIGFQVQVANLTVTDFFVTDSDVLKFTVSALAGKTSTTKIYVGNRGQPVDVIGETSWSYDSGTKIVTITRTHSSVENIEVHWGEADTTPPTYSNVAHNTTVETQVCEFSSYWDDNTVLSQWLFSWNGTGSWSNNTAVSFSSTPSWANATKTLPSAGTIVGYRWYANDTSNNWATTPIYSLTTTALGQDIVILLNEPSDGKTSYANSETFTYTPIFSGAIQNASLWSNVTGTWQVTAWNSSVVTNNTANSITYSFTDSGIYIWNIAVYNTTHAIFAEFNRTLIKSLEPRYSNIGTSTPYATLSCVFTTLFEDGDGLSGSIFGSNITYTWLNDTWTAWSGNPTPKLLEVTKTLPSIVPKNVTWQIWTNDTDNKWVTIGLQTLTLQVPSSVPSSLLFHISTYGTYINFGQQQSLSSTILSNNYWYFNGYGFQVQNANMTITNYFTNNQLAFTVSAPSGITSTTKVYVGDKGEPMSVKVDGVEVPIDYDIGTKILTITKLHSSLATIIIKWLPQGAQDVWNSVIVYSWLALGLISLSIVVFGAIFFISLFSDGANPMATPMAVSSLIGFIIVLYVAIIILTTFSSLLT